MHGLSVRGKGEEPRYVSLAEPAPHEGELVVQVEAAALSNLVRGQASGSHYSSSDTFPFTPGNDGVGRLQDGSRVYFLSPRPPFGSMAERSVVAASQVIVLPNGLGSVQAAAMGNPGLATWGALLSRAHLIPGEEVLVNGATGVTGREAVRVAKKLGAAKVIATGRSEADLKKLLEQGADEVVKISPDDADLASALQGVLEKSHISVVLDYPWGKSAEHLLRAISTQRHGENMPRVRFVQIGSISGQEISLSASTLRSSGIELLGSGLGSLSTPEILAALRRMYASWSPADQEIDTIAVPLRHSEAAWNAPTEGRRLVFTI